MAIVKKYKATVETINNPVDQIFTVEFSTSSGNFKFLPGQFLHLALDEYDPSSNWPESRCFSIQSPVSEKNLKITYSVKGEFTQRMAKELQPGKVIDIKMPYGEFFQQEHDKDNVVFIAGGTGLTPYLSLFNDPSFEEYHSPILYFGVRNEQYNIYQSQLQKALEINKSLIIKVKNQEKEGLLNIENIFQENGADKTYFISGPQLMIKLFKQELLKNNVPLNNIKTDDWE